MVHQIWLGDRRDDPTAANYSAEDLVVVQRDIGRLAQYTVEMGGDPFIQPAEIEQLDVRRGHQVRAGASHRRRIHDVLYPAAVATPRVAILKADS